MDVLWKNLIYSVRMLLKKPGLTAVAIIAMGLGIGANTAIFSVVNSGPAATTSVRPARTTVDDRNRAAQSSARRSRLLLSG